MTIPVDDKKARAEASIWLKVVAQVTGSVTLALAGVVALISAISGDWVSAGLYGGLTLWSFWGTYALIGSIATPRLGLGGRVTLLGFLFGSMLTLFESPSAFIHGKAASLTVWQTLCWLIGTVLVVVGLERERRASGHSQ